MLVHLDNVVKLTQINSCGTVSTGCVVPSFSGQQGVSLYIKHTRYNMLICELKLCVLIVGFVSFGQR